MKICFIGKYPPIEGGVSSKTYWLLKALGKRGHEIHVITNAQEVESEYREQFRVGNLKDYQPPGVTVHSTDPFINPQHIPYSKSYTEKLASYAIEIIRKYNLQLIDSWYILPYGVAGFIAKIITKRPQILRHAGSDITRLFQSPYLNTLFLEIFKRVDKMITYPRLKERFIALGVSPDKIFLNTKVSVDTEAFNPKVKPIDLLKYTGKKIKQNLPIITYIGKIGRTKGVFELIGALGQIKEEFILLLVTNGREIKQLEENITKNKLRGKTIFLGFVPPWRIPSVIRASTCVVHPEHDFPVRGHTPILPREVMACGTCLILSKELYQKRHSPKIKAEENILVVDPEDIKEFSNVLKKVIKEDKFAKKIGLGAQKVIEKTEDFRGYIEATEKLYRGLIQSL